MRGLKVNQIDMWTAASRAKYTAEIEALKPIARALADEAGERGVTVADLRLAGVERGLPRNLEGTAALLSRSRYACRWAGRHWARAPIEH